MSQSKKLAHALHNEEVCNWLNRKPEFTDWVITTAFYSAIHFVDHKLFPLKQNSVTYKSFEEYSLRANKFNENKHKLKSRLVSTEANSIFPAYNQLKEMSFNARYIDYATDRSISNKAIELLKEIKKYCS